MTVDKKVEAEIDALLADNEMASIIDHLLAMPRPEDADDSWERVLHARLQERLARKMRQVLDSGRKPKDSRHAA